MPRRNQPTRRPAGAASTPPPGLGERIEPWGAVDYRVRSVAGSSSQYRCPGCDQLVTVGRGHIVAWPADDPDATDRRHWHTACWGARENRRPGIVRSRNAPRYG